MDKKDNIPNDFDNLSKHAPLLSSIKKENSFSTPLDYFDELPNMISKKISGTKKESFFQKVFSSISFSNSFSIASVTAVVLVFTLFNRIPINQKEQVASEEIIDTISVDEIDMRTDNYLVAEVYKEQMTIDEEDNSNKDIEDYLIENTDEYIITEEL